MVSFKSEEFDALKGDVRLRAFRRFKDKPSGKPVLVLIHGSSLCALPSYDVRVPGRESEYSMMDICAARGYDVWTIDHEGYGASARTSSNSDVATGVDDISAMLPLLQRETGRSRYDFYGLSSGALRVAAFAQSRAEYVKRIVLDGFVWTGEGAPVLAKRREGLAGYLASHVRKIQRKQLLAIFHRDMPGSTEDAVAEASIDLQLSYGDMVPTGTFVDMCSRLPLVDPAKISQPVLMMRGAHDGVAALEDVAAFFVRLPNDEKQLTLFAGAAHIPHLGVNKDRFYHVLFNFLELPMRHDGAGNHARPEALQA